MRVVVLPVSGGAFAIQLGILLKLCDAKYQPDLVLSSSGGNVAAYTCLAANWKSQGIKRIVKSLNSNFFITSWTEGPFVFIPGWLVGFFRESFFNSSTVGIDFFKENFNSNTVVKTEIWTGTVECSQKKAQLFCNRDAKTSCIASLGNLSTVGASGMISTDSKSGVTQCQTEATSTLGYDADKSVTIKPSTVCKLDTKLYGCLEPIYLNGNVELVAQAALASASIPTIVPPQKINDKLYADGGVTHASPLTIMKDAINNLEEKYNPGLHITYINSFDLDKPDPISHNYMAGVHNGKITMFEIVQNFSIQDRIAGIDLIRHPDIKMYSTEGTITEISDITAIENARSKCRRSFIEYYPISNEAVDLKCFEWQDVDKLMTKTCNKFKYRVWWIGGDINLFTLPKISQASGANATPQASSK